MHGLIRGQQIDQLAYQQVSRNELTQIG
uniref:Uncharacterized protein n=1 Tax=Anguilla anguilla TaxID=7936 RepID=A0A0E9QI73_ANGAN